MNELADDWNAELEEELTSEDLEGLVVYSRDWTVETIMSQVTKGNIDLDPKFQRRNAWSEHKRSKLIESLIIRVPVPELVLAEDPNSKGSFIVIDGKQRLLAIAGFVAPEKYDSWQSPKLKKLTVRSDLDGVSFRDLVDDETYSDDLRLFQNADIRCTVISAYKSEKVLYDIFYRLNTGSVPLSSQELRQVLNRGQFANFLLENTSEPSPVHRVLNTKNHGPDARLRDAELLLRFIAIKMFGRQYSGDLSRFLDSTMRTLNQNWDNKFEEVEFVTKHFHEATETLLNVFPDRKVARKYDPGKNRFETRFNRALYEVEVFYFGLLSVEEATSNHEAFIEAFQKLCEDADFMESISTTTKTTENYYRRFSMFQSVVNAVYGKDFDMVPTPAPAA